MFGVTTPVLPYLGRTPLKGEGTKMVTRLTNVRRPHLLKGNVH
jgi:hypothetical protein